MSFLSRWGLLGAGLAMAGALAFSIGSGVRAAQEGASSSPAVAAIEHNNLGVGHMNQYLYQNAAESFRKAFAIDATFELARINLGIALFYGQVLDEAAKTLEASRSANPDNPYIHYVLGLIFKTQGESEAAAREFTRVTELDRNDAESLYNLGVLLARLRRNGEAEAAFRRALELQPMNTSVMYNLGTLLLKTGRTDEGNAMLERFRPLQQKGTVRSELAVGTQYGEMGRYALTLDYLPAFRSRAPESAPVSGPAPFADATRASGLAGLRLAAPPRPATRSFSPSQWDAEFLRCELLPSLGGSIALADLDNDGSTDVLVTSYFPAARQWRTVALLNDGKGKFTEAAPAFGPANSGSHVAAAVGDCDNDGFADVYLVGLGGNRLFRNLGRGRFEDITQKAGVGLGGLAVSAAFVDYDHDGDLDIYVSQYAQVDEVPSGDTLTFPESFPGAPNRMLRNNGDGTYLDYTESLAVGGGGRHHIGMIASDVDEDRDIDLIVLSEDGPPSIFVNERDDRFSEQSIQLPAGAGSWFRSMSVGDLDRDGNMDLFLGGRQGQPNALLMNRGNGTFSPDARSPELQRTTLSVDRSGTGFLDYDNDGDLDLYLWSPEPPISGTLWQNSGDGGYVFAGRLGADGGTAAAAADFNGDGRTDLLYLDQSGSPRLLINESAPGNHWLGIRLEGLRTNKAGFGAKVEIRAGSLYQKFELQGHNGRFSQDSSTLWLGLGAAPKADTVTVRWPSGILQSELNVPAGQVTRIRELDRKGTSCPLLYSWNGTGFEFVTDFLGGCAIGYLVGPRQYNTPDTDEYVRIDGTELVPRGGKYQVRMANQLEEIIMFDQAQLLVVDHPAGTEVYPNERLLSSPPFPEFQIFTARNPRPPASAIDGEGHDILPLISEKDREYPANFHLLPFKGYAEPHEIVLDLGPADKDSRVLLLMDAWIDYADSTANLAASQAGHALKEPYLQVRDRNGRWQTVLPQMGFPAGLPRTMTVDLTGRFLSGDHHVRIITNMRIYWDRIRVDTSEAESTRITRLNPSSAELRFLGYPAYYTPDGKHPWIYDYSRIQPKEFWQTHAGAYTRFGDVRELLLECDDMYVISRHGDEIALEFDAASATSLPSGWTRDYVLYADGFGKDMDLNSLYPESVGPLPFHGMTRFPYPASERYPNDGAHRRFQREYNTRVYPPGGGTAPVPTGGSPKQRRMQSDRSPH